MWRTLRSLFRRRSAAPGMRAVEFAGLLSRFLVMPLGIIVFGLDWYPKHTLNNPTWQVNASQCWWTLSNRGPQPEYSDRDGSIHHE